MPGYYRPNKRENNENRYIASFEAAQIASKKVVPEFKSGDTVKTWCRNQ